MQLIYSKNKNMTIPELICQKHRFDSKQLTMKL